MIAREGDTVLLYNLRRRLGEPTPLVVYKTGRKWGWAKPEGKNYPDVKFDLTTGYEDRRGYSAMQRVLTPEMAAHEGRRNAATDQLRSFGLRFDSGGHLKAVSTETLEAIVALLSRGQAQDGES